jgi:hypothetical protein
MKRQYRRTAEILVVLAAYTAVFLLVLGPAVGAAVPGFDQPAFTGADGRPTGDLPDTPRGWLLVVTMVPVLLGYMYLRARVAGVGIGEFWNPPGEQA